jgi:energy-coupling factor transport system permease protein
MRFLVVVAGARLLFLTTDFAEMSGGVRSLQRPWLGRRLNAFLEIVAFVLAFSFQSVPLVANEFAAVVEAERGRGVDVDAGSVAARIGNYVRMLPVLFLRCLTVGQFTVMALINYHYDPFRPRTLYRQFRFTGADWAATAFLVASTLAISATTYVSLTI